MPAARKAAHSRAIAARLAPMHVRCASTGTPHARSTCSASAQVFAPVEPPAAP